MLTALGSVACTDSGFENPTGEASFRGVNGVAGLANVFFLIEETPIGDTLPFKSATGTQSYDDLTYRFNFDLPRPGEDPERLASSEVDVVRDTDYTFVLAGDVAAQQMFVWQRPERVWSDTETVFDLNIGHANTSLGAVDVYVAAPATLPVTGNAAGTVAFGERLDAQEFAAGEYQIVVTNAGDPSTVVYQSATVTIAAADSYQLIVLDADPDTTGPISVRLINQASAAAELADERFAPTAQFVNASLATGPIDVAIDSDFTTLAVANLPFAGVSGDVEVPNTANYQYVSAGTTTAALEEEAVVAPGTRNLVVLAGEPGELQTIGLPSVRRGFSNLGRLRLINTITTNELVDIYVLPPGTDVSDSEVLPSLVQVTLGFESLTAQLPGDYELTVTPHESRTPLVGPTLVSLPTDEVVEVILLDTIDPNTAELLIFSNTTP